MRGKRSKQYRKLMHQYELSFNFRVPYQVLVDADMIKDTFRFKMNLPLYLERTLHGQVKPSMSFAISFIVARLKLTSKSDHTVLDTPFVYRRSPRRRFQKRMD
jgi:rRNA-processing protein FCF1